jgi:hypothetical protein
MLGRVRYIIYSTNMIRGVFTYNSMLYMIGRRLNNCHFLTRFMRTHAVFFFVTNVVVLSRVIRGHWSMC